VTKTVPKSRDIGGPARRLSGILKWQIREDYQKDVLFIATLGGAAFYFSALWGFTPLDPSWISASFPKIAPSNAAGQVGANLSAIALYSLGLAAYLVPVPVIIGTTLLVTKIEQTQSRGRYLGWTMFILATATLSARYMQPLIFDEYAMPSGGVVGSTLAKIFRKNFGDLGSKIFYLTIAAISLILITKSAILSDFFTWTNKSCRQGLGEARAGLIALFKRQGSETWNEPEFQTSQPEISPVPEAQKWSSDSVPQEVKRGDESGRSFETVPVRKIISEVLSTYAPPPVSTFKKSENKGKTSLNKSELDQVSAHLVATLGDFGVAGKMIGYQSGPVVTVYEFQPDAGIKQSKVLGLIDDLALSLKVDSIFIHPVRGKRALGIQVPNSKREMVFLGDLLESKAFLEPEAPLTFVMGKSLSGEPVCANLAETPHILIAGSTGSGKSVGINTLLCSLIMKSSPQDVRMILVDPKMLELSVYEGIPHLLMPVITEPNKANLALRWAVNEMERRYRLLQSVSVRNIDAFNTLWRNAGPAKQEEIRMLTEDPEVSHLPYVVLVIDELADLMLTAPKDIESIIQRLAQKARASGIHLVLATQRPSVDIITGVIKANLPTRIAFQVVSRHDSRTILDQMGADKLLGKGDMLFQRPGVSALERIQGAFVSDEEVVSLVSQIKAKERATYDSKLMTWIEAESIKQDDDSLDSTRGGVDDDPKWDEAISIAQNQGAISASFLQRQLKIGYNRAARIVETMEKQGLVDKADGAKPRRWLGSRTGSD
jgi:S-DNA-T family DNA segregation ATPase FtsK/SpoIIIE